MSTEIVTHQASTDLAVQMDFARAVSASSVLPRAYKDNPGSVLIAVNLGAAMGLAPAESLYRIHVIEGKPSASAELIAANVRRAGHRLRVRGDDQHAQVQIVRADDPEWPFEVEWTIDRAKAAGLTGKDVWKKYPAAMLKARAITECARMACPEALYGVTYATEELDDAREVPTTRRESVADLLAATEPARAPEPTPEPVEAAVVEPDAPEPLTDRTRGHLFALLHEQGIEDREQQIAGIVAVIGRPIASRSELTEDEARAVIIELEMRASRASRAAADAGQGQP